MKSKDILKMLDEEVSNMVPDKMSDKVTATPIRTRKETIEPARKVVPRRSFVHSRAFQVMCACLVCVAVITGIVVPILANGGGGVPPVGPDDINAPIYLSVDINPSVDFVIGADGKVKNVISKNNDGDILLSQGFRESLIGQNMTEAVNATLDQATKLGYIDASNISTTATANAVRVSIAGDDSASVGKLLKSTRDSVTNHMKSKNIFMVVVGKEVAPKDILGNSGIASIEDWNDVNETKGGYHYINNVVGMDQDEIKDSFKRDFLSEYVGDALDDAFEDIDEALELIAEIDALEEELMRAQSGSLIHRTYWDLLDEEIEDETVNELVDEITECIEEYNEKLLGDEDSLVDISRFLSKIDIENTKVGAITLGKMKAISKVYRDTGLGDKIDEHIDKISENLDRLDDFLTALNNRLGEYVESIREFTTGIKTKINAKIDEVTGEAEQYYNVCKAEIDRSYTKLVAQNGEKKGTVTPEEYDRMMQEILDEYDDLDDFWAVHHK